MSVRELTYGEAVREALAEEMRRERLADRLAVRQLAHAHALLPPGAPASRESAAARAQSQAGGGGDAYAKISVRLSVTSGNACGATVAAPVTRLTSR